MKLYARALPLLAALALGLGGCSPQDASDKNAPTAGAAAAQPYEAAATQGSGFTAGAMMSANTVYVLFDPQCPHCGRLWQASLPLHGKLKFVWIPVAFNFARSGPQGAALLAAANPTALMNEHEQSLLAGGGGISASANVPPALEQAIRNNTQLLTNLGADSVPYIVAKNLRSGQVVTNAGALETPALAEFLGLN